MYKIVRPKSITLSNNSGHKLESVSLKIYEPINNNCDSIGRLVFTKTIYNMAFEIKDRLIIPESKRCLRASVNYGDMHICDVPYTIESKYLSVFMNIGKFNRRDCKSIILTSKW